MTDELGQRRADCPICGGTSLSIWYEGGPGRSVWKDLGVWRVDACGDCGHAFTNPRPGDAMLDHCYNAAYPPYRAGHGTGGSDESVIANARKTGGYRYVEIRSGMRVLDVGCGGGAFLNIARDLGAVVQGVEPSAHGVESCRNQGLPVFHGDLRAFAATSGAKFDLITANHVMEHHSDPVAMFSEMKSLLAEGGQIWVATPNAACRFSRALRGDWHSADLPVHLQHFSRTSLARCAEEAGLIVEKTATASENSLAGSLAQLLRRYFVPGKLTLALLGGALAKDGWLGRRIDAAGQGEAIQIRAHT